MAKENWKQIGNDYRRLSRLDALEREADRLAWNAKARRESGDAAGADDLEIGLVAVRLEIFSVRDGIR